MAFGKFPKRNVSENALKELSPNNIRTDTFYRATPKPSADQPRLRSTARMVGGVQASVAAARRRHAGSDPGAKCLLVAGLSFMINSPPAGGSGCSTLLTTGPGNA